MTDKTKKNSKIKNEKGLTLMEVMVAIFIFSLMMVAVVQIFSNSTSGYRNAVKIQRNLEEAQYAINQIMKTLRTSTIVECKPSCSAASINEIKVFDYSRGSTNSCIVFKFESKKIMVGSSDHSDAASCDGDAVSANKEMTAGRIEDMKFEIVESRDQGNPSGPRVGKVTVSAEVCTNESGACSSTGIVKIQSTVSLRDYDVSFQ